MPTTDQIISDVLSQEGGYQNRESDTGNYYEGQNLGTNHGITPSVLARYRGTPVTKEDMKNLSADEARTIYEEQYAAPVERWNPPEAVAPMLVDMNVNHGQGNTVVMLQRALGVPVDGKMGPKTKAAMQHMDPELLRERLIKTREEFYTDLVRRRPKMSEWYQGWIKRARSFGKDS